MSDPDPCALPDKRLLIVEDDPGLLASLAGSFTRRGYQVRTAMSTKAGLVAAPRFAPTHALVDLKLPGASGLDCVAGLAALANPPRIVVLTGFAAITTAVEAIKLGASHYLAKPATPTEIEAAFAHQAGSTELPIEAARTPLKMMEWEQINAMLAETDYNISETARRLGMHRRTLARKLAREKAKPGPTEA